MNNENINIPEEDFNEGLEDIEQMLNPQCEFKASDTLKEEVLAQARKEVKPQRKVNLWPWVAAACTRGEESRRSAPCPSGQCLSYKASAHGI